MIEINGVKIVAVESVLFPPELPDSTRGDFEINWSLARVPYSATVNIVGEQISSVKISKITEQGELANMSDLEKHSYIKAKAEKQVAIDLGWP